MLKRVSILCFILTIAMALPSFASATAAPTAKPEAPWKELYTAADYETYRPSKARASLTDALIQIKGTIVFEDKLEGGVMRWMLEDKDGKQWDVYHSPSDSVGVGVGDAVTLYCVYYYNNAPFAGSRPAMDLSRYESEKEDGFNFDIAYYYEGDIISEEEYLKFSEEAVGEDYFRIDRHDGKGSVAIVPAADKTAAPEIETTKFIYNQFEVAVSKSVTVEALDGNSVIKIPATVKNLRKANNSISASSITAYAPDGSETELRGNYYDDSVEKSKAMRTGGAAEMFIYVNYDGDGDYRLAFADSKFIFTITVPVTK